PFGVADPREAAVLEFLHAEVDHEVRRLLPEVLRVSRERAPYRVPLPLRVVELPPPHHGSERLHRQPEMAGVPVPQPLRVFRLEEDAPDPRDSLHRGGERPTAEKPTARPATMGEPLFRGGPSPDGPCDTS